MNRLSMLLEDYLNGTISKIHLYGSLIMLLYTLIFMSMFGFSFDIDSPYKEALLLGILLSFLHLLIGLGKIKRNGFTLVSAIFIKVVLFIIIGSLGIAILSSPMVYFLGMILTSLTIFISSIALFLGIGKNILGKMR